MNAPKVQLLLTGNELMTGDIVDSNSALMAQTLKELGLEITRKVTVADDLALLVDEINYITQSCDILIINGGLGPTVDDLTAKALSIATDIPLKENHQARIHVENWCQKRNIEANEPNLKQAILPENCQILDNKNGSAVGFTVRHNECDVYCTPGVPHELKTMLNDEIVPFISQSLPDNLVADVTRLQIFGLGESSLQKIINEEIPDWPSNIELGFRAGDPLLEIKLTTNTPEGLAIKPTWQAKLINILGDHVIAEVKGEVKSLAEHVLNNLQIDNLKVTTAESCTGGLIASQLTSISGSSKSFEAGFVTYSNEMKTVMIDVPSQYLNSDGAVSEAVVIAMAKGALKKSNADLAISVSGIAGPNGGSAEKPVGMVWLAWGSVDDIKTQCLLLPYHRKMFQKMVASIGLDLLRRYQLNLKTVPNYVKERAFSSQA